MSGRNKAGDAETGVTIMRMDAGLDTGPMLLRQAVPVGPTDTAGMLHDRLADTGARMIVDALDRLPDLPAVPQPAEGVTYAAKIDKAEARLDFSKPARDVHNLVRGLSPFPGAWFEADFGRGSERIKVLRTRLAHGDGAPGTLIGEGIVACGDGAVELTQVQRGGKSPMSFADFARGARLAIGAKLG